MTPKEKAEELVDRYMNIRNVKLSDYSIIYLPTAKQCALIAVDEILSDYKNYLMHENTEYKGLMYWQEVKKEIELL
jgi:NADH:ubiquinone oxidoreductase subunit E